MRSRVARLERTPSSWLVGLSLLLLGCEAASQVDAPAESFRASPTLQQLPPAKLTPVLLASLTPRYTQEFSWSEAGRRCVPTWEGKDRQSIPSHLRSSPFRSMDSKESSSVNLEHLILPGCRELGARRAALYERPVPFERFDLPKMRRRVIFMQEKRSSFFLRLESLWRSVSMSTDGPEPAIAAQNTIIHYARRNLFSFTFSIDTLAPHFNTELRSHTLFRESGKDVHFADLINPQGEQIILKELNGRLSEQIEERNHQVLAGGVEVNSSFELFHQSQAGSVPCEPLATRICTPTRFFKKDLDHFIIHPLGLVFFHDFALPHTADAQTPLSEVLLPFHFLKPYLKRSGMLGNWGNRSEISPNQQKKTRSL